MAGSWLTKAEAAVVLLSVQVAGWAVLASLPLAVAAAYVLARGHFIGKSLLEVLVDLPLVLPPVVTGYLLLMLLGRRGVIGQWLSEYWGMALAFHWTGASLAAAVMGFPLMVRAIRLSVESVDRRLEKTAATLGAGPLWSFFTITLPLSVPGVVAGCVLGFARALGEFGATITFAANIPGQTQTLPLAIYSLLQTPNGEVAAIRLSLMAVGIAFAALVASRWLTKIS